MDSQRLWIKQGSYLQVFALIELEIFAYTYVFQSESTLYSFLNVKELLAENTQYQSFKQSRFNHQFSVYLFFPLLKSKYVK